MIFEAFPDENLKFFACSAPFKTLVRIGKRNYVRGHEGALNPHTRPRTGQGP